MFDVDPFVSIDQEGVGELVQIGTERGRRKKPDLKIGICGEHGGDPASVEFFHRTGLSVCVVLAVPGAGGAIGGGAGGYSWQGAAE